MRFSHLWRTCNQTPIQRPSYGRRDLLNRSVPSMTQIGHPMDDIFTTAISHLYLYIPGIYTDEDDKDFAKFSLTNQATLPILNFSYRNRLRII
ncbi:Uncharacterized protein APZ42_033906 [Daphnia magna]|uniref:Uncharacterized protein n=1 Tax=Daphnia magna TaxID=35525 RepID=A0A164KLV9_9CRUS|nr:Uncharacterized protein APZ42_033906 [Daphnia magna]